MPLEAVAVEKNQDLNKTPHGRPSLTASDSMKWLDGWMVGGKGAGAKAGPYSWLKA